MTAANVRRRFVFPAHNIAADTFFNTEHVQWLILLMFGLLGHCFQPGGTFVFCDGMAGGVRTVWASLYTARNSLILR